MRRKLIRAELALILATLLWGGTFAVLKIGLSDISPILLVAIRFSFSTFLFLPLVFHFRRKGLVRAMVTGMGTGLIMFFAYGLQTVGLQTTSPGRSAFITQLLILFTPGLQLILGRTLPGILSMSGIVFILPGLYFLFSPNMETGVSMGDLLTLGCAFMFALYIVVLDRASQRNDLSPLMFFQTLGVSVFSWVYVVLFEELKLENPGSLLVVFLYLSPFATNFTVYLQNRFQKETGPTRASIIYTMEPMFATLIAAVLLNDVLTLRESLGAVFLIAGFLTEPVLRMIPGWKGAEAPGPPQF